MLSVIQANDRGERGLRDLASGYKTYQYKSSIKDIFVQCVQEK